MSKDSEILTVKVSHPSFGHVIFSQLTSRELDILTVYSQILEAKKEYPNDKEFGSAMRKLLG